jgi:SOS-response transcriptional repressor LexA
MKILKGTRKFLTKKQKAVLDYIVSCINTNGYAPTEQEIADFLGAKRSLALYYVNVLKEKGYIRRPKKRKSRNIEVII